MVCDHVIAMRRGVCSSEVTEILSSFLKVKVSSKSTFAFKLFTGNRQSQMTLQGFMLFKLALMCIAKSLRVKLQEGCFCTGKLLTSGNSGSAFGVQGSSDCNQNRQIPLHVQVIVDVVSRQHLV